jgi:hypothetical protein
VYGHVELLAGSETEKSTAVAAKARPRRRAAIRRFMDFLLVLNIGRQFSGSD